MMIYVALLIIILIVLITCLVMISRASTLLHEVPGYDTDTLADKAYTRLVYSSVLGWLAVIAIVGVIAAVIYSGGETGIPTISKYLFIICAIMSLVIGITAASSSISIGNSKLYPTGDIGNVAIVQSFEYSAFGSAIALLTFVFIIIAISVEAVGGIGEKEGMSTSKSNILAEAEEAAV